MKYDACEWAMVRHGKTGRDQLEHVHLVVNLVQTESGKPASVHNDYSRAQAACAKLSRQLGLTELQGQQRHLPERERRRPPPDGSGRASATRSSNGSSGPSTRPPPPAAR